MERTRAIAVERVAPLSVSTYRGKGSFPVFYTGCPNFSRSDPSSERGRFSIHAHLGHLSLGLPDIFLSIFSNDEDDMGSTYMKPYSQDSIVGAASRNEAAFLSNSQQELRGGWVPKCR